jgi:hypothetical protein
MRVVLAAMYSMFGAERAVVAVEEKGVQKIENQGSVLGSFYGNTRAGPMEIRKCLGSIVKTC